MPLPPNADSLNSMLMPETMEGDNQYSCEFCGHKVGRRGGTPAHFL